MFSPLELDQIEFEKKVFGGYDTEEVDETFDRLKKDYGELYLENVELKAKIKELGSKTTEYSEMTETLREILVTAQKTADDTVGNAKVEAELIKKTAETEAREAVRKAEAELEELKKKKEELKCEVDTFVTRMSALFEAQIKYLGNIE